VVHKVSPEQYVETVAALRPDMLTALADEVDAAATRKRASASVSRTAKWLDACLSAWAAAGMTAPVLAPVTGALHIDERARSAREAAARDGVAGFALTGTGQSPRLAGLLTT
jgi:tRNA-guanine family transglycosylase